VTEKKIPEKVAVIIPVYLRDNFDYLKQAVKSILNQTCKSQKLYIAADGPLRPEVLEYLSALDKNKAEILLYKENRGLGAVLNDAIRHCKNLGFKFIARMDADDIAHADRIRAQVEYLENHPDVFILGTQAYIIDSNEKTIGIKNARPEIDFKVLKSKCDIIHPSIMFRAEFFDKVGYYAEDIYPVEDYDLWFRAAIKNVKMQSIPDRLYYFRYDHRIIDRRKGAQALIIKVKRRYLNFMNYHHLLSHIAVLLLPRFILKIVLHKSIQPDMNNIL
jgi:glycosyltransferase involved in cell wall biosynthesis